MQQDTGDPRRNNKRINIGRLKLIPWQIFKNSKNSQRKKQFRVEMFRETRLLV